MVDYICQSVLLKKVRYGGWQFEASLEKKLVRLISAPIKKMGVVVHAYDCSYEDHSPMPAQDKT
jgi:hypothetical protein